MSKSELIKLEIWYDTLQDISEVYPGNINLNTVMTSIMARIKENKKE